MPLGAGRGERAGEELAFVGGRGVVSGIEASFGWRALHHPMRSPMPRWHVALACRSGVLAPRAAGARMAATRREINARSAREECGINGKIGGADATLALLRMCSVRWRAADWIDWID